MHVKRFEEDQDNNLMKQWNYVIVSQEIESEGVVRYACIRGI